MRPRMKASVTGAPTVTVPLDVTWIIGVVRAASFAVVAPEPIVWPLDRRAHASTPTSRASTAPPCVTTMRPAALVSLVRRPSIPTANGASISAAARVVIVAEPRPKWNPARPLAFRPSAETAPSASIESPSVLAPVPYI